MKKNKVFLGGTCNNTTWRDELIPLLKIDYFNPVVKDWTPECQKTEEIEKIENCNIHFYYITSEMTGVFSIAEVVESSHNKNKVTIFVVSPVGFTPGQLKSLQATMNLVSKNGGITLMSADIDEVAKLINTINVPQQPIKLFFDTEFTGLQNGTTLISIGIVSECGKTFYAELTDYDKLMVGDWIQQNVIDKLVLTNQPESRYIKQGNDITIRCNLKTLKFALIKWLEQFDKVEMWSDCLSYDWVVFNEIFGTALDIPKKIYYIPYDICTLFKYKGIDPDINREEFAEVDDQELKHNALFDAMVIKECYNKLMK